MRFMKKQEGVAHSKVGGRDDRNFLKGPIFWTYCIKILIRYYRYSQRTKGNLVERIKGKCDNEVSQNRYVNKERYKYMKIFKFWS